MASFYYYYQNPAGYNAFLYKLGLLLIFKPQGDYQIFKNMKEKKQHES